MPLYVIYISVYNDYYYLLKREFATDKIKKRDYPTVINIKLYKIYR